MGFFLRCLCYLSFLAFFTNMCDHGTFLYVSLYLIKINFYNSQCFCIFSKCGYSSTIYSTCGNILDKRDNVLASSIHFVKAKQFVSGLFVALLSLNKNQPRRGCSREVALQFSFGCGLENKLLLLVLIFHHKIQWSFLESVVRGGSLSVVILLLLLD